MCRHYRRRAIRSPRGGCTKAHPLNTQIGVDQPIGPTPLSPLSAINCVRSCPLKTLPTSPRIWDEPTYPFVRLFTARVRSSPPSFSRSVATHRCWLPWTCGHRRSYLACMNNQNLRPRAMAVALLRCSGTNLTYASLARSNEHENSSCPYNARRIRQHRASRQA
jgi:hypothetical protein